MNFKREYTFDGWVAWVIIALAAVGGLHLIEITTRYVIVPITRSIV